MLPPRHAVAAAAVVFGIAAADMEFPPAGVPSVPRRRWRSRRRRRRRQFCPQTRSSAKRPPAAETQALGDSSVPRLDRHFYERMPLVPLCMLVVLNC
jgi:hypothetical protein